MVHWDERLRLTCSPCCRKTQVKRDAPWSVCEQQLAEGLPNCDELTRGAAFWRYTEDFLQMDPTTTAGRDSVVMFWTWIGTGLLFFTLKAVSKLYGF